MHSARPSAEGEMTVAELIRELRKYPKDARVGFQDHDSYENEVSSHVHNVYPFDPETSFDPDFCRNVLVVLRGG